MRRQVEGRLAGWQPFGMKSDPLQFVEGSLVQFEGDGLLWWSDKYAFIRYGGI